MWSDTVANTGNRIRVPLASLQAVYDGPGRIGFHGPLPRDEDGMHSIDATLGLLSGIRITAEKEPFEVLEYLNELEKRFVLRGRIKRQARKMFGNLRIGRSVVYATTIGATHRVLVFAYYGKLSGDSPQESVRVPLARVDVRPPFSYLSGRYKVLEEYQAAVLRYAEKIALEWYRGFAKKMMPKFSITRTKYGIIYDKQRLDPMGAASGWSAVVIARLSRKDLSRQRVWPMKQKPKRIGTAGVKPAINTVRAFNGSATFSLIGGE